MRSVSPNLFCLKKFYRTAIIKYMGVNMTELQNVTFKGTAVETTGINTVNTADNSTITEIYTLGGARVNSLQKGINIVRLANGKTVKVIK